MKTAEILAANVTALMSRRGWSQQRLAGRANISQAAVSYVLTGSKSPTLETLDAIAAALGVPSWKLLAPEGTDTVGIDQEAMVDALEAVDQVLAEESLELSTNKRAQLTAIIYDLAIRGQIPDDKVKSALVRLAK